MEIIKRKMLHGTRFLSFEIGDETYGMEIMNVKELMGMTSITPIPQTPSFIKGVLNLRGNIVPVIDLRLKFGMPAKEYTKRTCIIITDIKTSSETALMGLVVDNIQEVIGIPDEKISRIPYINAKIKSEYIKGIADTPEGIKIILDVVRILNEEELAKLADLDANVNTRNTRSNS